MNTTHDAHPDSSIDTGNYAVRIPIGHILTSLLGLGPIPVTKVSAVHTLVAEANRGARPEGVGLTNYETAVRSVAERHSQTTLDRAVTGKVERTMKQIKALHAEIGVIERALTTLASVPLVGPSGARYTYDEAVETHDADREQIHTDQREGSRKHTLRRRRPLLETGLLALDLPVFTFALFGLLNVNPRLIALGDFATLWRAGLALLFAAFGTVVLAVVVRSFGSRHRDHKGHDGESEATGAARRTQRFEIVGLVVAVFLAVATMAGRVVLEGAAAEANLFLLVSLAGLLGGLVALSAYVNYRAVYDDGSLLTDRVEVLSMQIRGRREQERRLADVLQMKVEMAGVSVAKLARMVAEVRSRALSGVTGDVRDKAIHVARSYHSPSRSALPDPELDYSRLDLAAVQASRINTEQERLESFVREL